MVVEDLEYTPKLDYDESGTKVTTFTKDILRDNILPATRNSRRASEISSWNCLAWNTRMTSYAQYSVAASQTMC